MDKSEKNISSKNKDDVYTSADNTKFNSNLTKSNDQAQVKKFFYISDILKQKQTHQKEDKLPKKIIKLRLETPKS